jgi:YHS domain-containing protein
LEPGAAAILRAGLALTAYAAGWIWVVAAVAATTERIVTNPRTGLAIDGYDPVSYFIAGAAMVGRAEFEVRYRGAVWRFRNSGNQAAFMDRPADYEPHFGGYDPVAVARGAPTPGSPEIWLIAGRTLYLFYSVETRGEFQSDPTRLATQAEAKWPDVVRVLAQ